ncbi:MAG TPA: hypothetical protein VJA19_23605 [Pseudomonas sp.]|nr:hypothetical protein [Pseudomonas sp.]
MKMARCILAVGMGGVIGAAVMLVYLEVGQSMSPVPWIVIDIKNQASQDIVGVSVENVEGVVKHSGLNKGAEMRLPVSHARDGGYKITFFMKNGAVFTSGSDYAEPGSSVVALVTDQCFVTNKCIN